MTDNLSNKFEQLEALMVSQHGAVIDALNSILAALGQPPVGGTATLQDVVDAIDAVHTSVLGVSSAIGTSNAELVTIRTNVVNTGSYTFQILSKLGQVLQELQTLDFCCGNTAHPFLPPLLGTNEVAQDEMHCKVCQEAIDIIIDLIRYLERIATSGVDITIDAVAEAFDQEPRLVNCPRISKEELGTLVLAVEGIRSGNIGNLEDTIFNSKVTFYSLLFDQVTAAAGRTVWDSQVILNYQGSHERAIVSGVLYDGFLNCLYSSPPGLGGAGYEGTVCGEIVVDCITADSAVVTATPDNGYANRNQVVFPGMGAVSSIEYAPGLFVSYSEPVIMTSGFTGGRITSIAGRIRVVSGVAGTSIFADEIGQAGQWVDIRPGVDYLILDDFMSPNEQGSGPFTAEFCPPGNV